MKRGHFLQSEEWEKFEQLDGKKTLRVSGEGFFVLAVVEEIVLGKYLFCPYGPVVFATEKLTLEQGLERAFNELVKMAKAEKAFFVRVEPTSLEENGTISVDFLKKYGLVKSHDIDPAATWVVNLDCTRDELLHNMEDKKRKKWRNYEKNGIVLRKTKDVEEIGVLSFLLKKVGDRNNFTPMDEKHLANQLKSGFATLYVAEFEGKPVAASLVYDYDGVRYAVHAGADDEYKKLAAGTIISVQEMVDAQEDGGRKFDFWGITLSDDKNHPWYGFTQYKKTFGGSEVIYAGTWDLVVDKVKYGAYKVMRGVRRRLR